MRQDVVKTDFGIVNNITGVRYLGVSKFLSSYHEPFNPIAVAESLSEKTGIDPDVYLKEWRESAEKGTETHKQIESIIVNKDFSSELGMAIRQAIDSALYDSKLSGQWHSELICYCDSYCIAGVADLVIINKREKRFIVVDFKTTKKLRFESYDHKKMAFPFAVLDDCNYNHAQLQLNCYGLLLSEESGYECVGMFVAHVNQLVDLYKVTNYFSALRIEMEKRKKVKEDCYTI